MVKQPQNFGSSSNLKQPHIIKLMFEVSGRREKVSRVHKTNDDAHGHYYWELRDNTTLTISDRLPLMEG